MRCQKYKTIMNRLAFLKLASAALISGAFAVSLAGCGDKKEAAAPAGGETQAAAPAKTLTVGVNPVPGGDIMKFLQPVFKKQGIELKIVEFSDYVQPNLALADGSIDANLFQHGPYLEDFAKQHNLKIAALTTTYIAPLGVYSKTLKKPADIAEGATVAVPNDPTNGSRALRLLEQEGLIGIRKDAPFLVSPADIDQNPKHLKVVEVEAAQLPRSLEDAAIAVINCTFALGAGLNPVKDAIAIESKDSPYANVVAIRIGDENRPEIQLLKKEVRTPEVKKFIEEHFKGSLVPTF